MRILVTGGLGFIGTRLVMELQKCKDHEITLLDLFTPQVHSESITSKKKVFGNNVNIIIEDMCDNFVKKLPYKRYDVIFNLASETGVGQSQYEVQRYIKNNNLSLANLSELLIKDQIQTDKIIHSSSRAVYGEGLYFCNQCNQSIKPSTRIIDDKNTDFWMRCHKCNCILKPIPITEKHSLDPISLYGLTKKFQEEQLEWLKKRTDINIIIFRLFNVYGLGQDVNNPYTGIIPAFIKQASTDGVITLYEDGQMSRDFVEISDVIKSLVRGLEFNKSKVLNIGSGQDITLIDVAKKIFAHLDKKTKIDIPGLYRHGDIKSCIANIEESSKNGIITSITFNKGIQKLLNDYDFKKISSLNGLSKSQEEENRFRVLHKLK